MVVISHNIVMHHLMWLQVLFPSSYHKTGQWMAQLSADAQGVMERCRQQLEAAINQDGQFNRLAAGCQVRRDKMVKVVYLTPTALLQQQQPGYTPRHYIVEAM